MGIDTRKRDSTDRRQKSRFPIHRELRFRLLQEGRVMEVGQGETINIGSGGVWFSLDRELPVGAFIELSISWPVQLESGTPMRLVVFGRVLRTGDRRSACTVDKYEFRTQARPAQTAPGKGVDTVPRRWASGMAGGDPIKGGILQFGLTGYRG